MKILSSHVTQDSWNCTMFDFTGLCQVQNVIQLKLFHDKSMLNILMHYPFICMYTAHTRMHARTHTHSGKDRVIQYVSHELTIHY